jgi:DNA-binding PadR family transcriptional regulator
VRSKSDPNLLVLASLADGDKHGYAMMVDIKAFAGVELGPGTLYGAITRLEAHGLVKGLASSDRRRPYRLTAAGRAKLEQQIAALEPVVRVGARRLRRA